MWVREAVRAGVEQASGIIGKVGWRDMVRKSTVPLKSTSTTVDGKEGLSLSRSLSSVALPKRLMRPPAPPQAQDQGEKEWTLKS